VLVDLFRKSKSGKRRGKRRKRRGRKREREGKEEKRKEGRSRRIQLKFWELIENIRKLRIVSNIYYSE
jgi:hypothetical protein